MTLDALNHLLNEYRFAVYERETAPEDFDGLKEKEQAARQAIIDYFKTEKLRWSTVAAAMVNHEKAALPAREEEKL